jgi:hypothetical protein
MDHQVPPAEVGVEGVAVPLEGGHVGLLQLDQLLLQHRQSSGTSGGT